MNSATIIGDITKVSAKWARQRKAEERAASRRFRRYDAMTCSDRTTIRDAAWQVMEKAYLKASSGGTLPAHARQIMYAARGEILELTSKQTLSDQYFCQTLLPDYLNERPRGWDVVFDARGHFHEPHTGRTVPLGTIEVRNYLGKVNRHTVGPVDVPEIGGSQYPTCGPRHRFNAILFVEKEGFAPLFRATKLAERFDIAIMSTKGLSVTASRHLVDELGGGFDIPLLVIRDFDKAGFSIAGTLQRDTRRYEFMHSIKVVDLGLRLEDVEANDLPSETVIYGKTNPKYNLDENGATKEEIAFLFDSDSSWPGYCGKRVELNAFTSGNFVAWIEAKLKEHDIEKVVPDTKTLTAAYRRATEASTLNKIVRAATANMSRVSTDVDVPDDLEQQVRHRLAGDPKLTWDEAVSELVDDRDTEAV